MKKSPVIFLALLFTLTAVICTVSIAKNNQKAEAVVIDYSDYVNSPSWDHDYVHTWDQGYSFSWNYATGTLPTYTTAKNTTEDYVTTTQKPSIPNYEATDAAPTTTATTEGPSTTFCETTSAPETTTAEYTTEKPTTVPATESTKTTTAPGPCYPYNGYRFKCINQYPPVTNENMVYVSDVFGTTRIPESSGGNTITGTYGTISWSFDIPSGELRIYGSGVVKNTYDFVNINFGEVKKIIFGNGITELGSGSFMCLDNLTDVIISDTVETIGESAFAWCRSLKNVKLGSNLVSLGKQAFESCTSLEKIEIPDNVRTIGNQTFLNCTKLKKAVLGRNTNEIGMHAFEACSSLKEVVFSENLKTIGPNAFGNCIALYEISIPDSVESIGIKAFYGCLNLKKISIGEGIRNIGAHAFCNTGYYFNPDNWENGSLYLDNCLLDARDIKAQNYSIKEGTRVIGGKAFFNEFPASVYIPEGVKGISDEAFANCGTKPINIPESVDYIGILAFAYEPELDEGTPFEISANVKKIGEGAFANRNITEFRVDENNAVYSTDENGVLYSKDMKKLIAFPDKNPLKDFTIPDNVEEIGDFAFASCNLQNIAIPDSVEKIGYGAFALCPSLSELIFPDSVKETGKFIISESTMTLFDTGNGVTDIDAYAYEVEQMIIGKSVKTLNSNCSKKYIVDPENEYFSSDEYGVLYNKEKTTIISFPIKSSIEHYIMPSTVVSSDSSILSPSLKTITFSENFYSGNNIADHKYLWEFSRFSAFTAEKFIMPEANPLFCTDENGIIFSKNKEILYRYPSKATNEEFTVPEGVKIIASNAFFNCNSLTKITVPESVIIIGSDAFSFCRNLGEINLPDNPMIIRNSAFNYTEYYDDENNWYNDCLYIGNHLILAFPCVFDNGEWGNIRLKEGIIDIASYSIYNGGSYPIVNVYIPKSVKFISPDAFECVYNLQNIYYSGSQEEWEEIQIVNMGNHHLFDAVIYCNATDIPSAPAPSPETIVDEDTGVSIEIDSSKYYGEVEIIVEENIDDNSAFDIITTETEVDDFALYDIKMTLDGEEIQPLEWVAVRLPLPENFDPSRSIVFYVNTATGKIEQMNARFEDGFMVFETDHFSYYAIIEEVVINAEIRTPSTTTINYGDSIWLHVQIRNLPDGASIIWTPSNNNFEIVEVSADGKSCKIIPKSSGTTTFTVSVVDENENVLITDTQDMTSKAGLWQKIVAFFKKIFGATKTYPELYKSLF